MTAPQCCDCYRKFNSFSDNIARVLRLARKRTVDMLRNTAKCHDVPCLHAMGNKATRRWTPQKVPNFPKALPCVTQLDGCERLPTVACDCVASMNARSSERTIKPQTPTLKREPLLLVREKGDTITTWRPVCDSYRRGKSSPFVIVSAENLIHPRDHGST